MNNVIGTIYSSRQFSWNRDTKTFYADITDVPQVLRQLWNDSMDLGFGITSAKTNRIVYFILESVQKFDGEVLTWTFVPSPLLVSKNPGLIGLTVVIFND